MRHNFKKNSIEIRNANLLDINNLYTIEKTAFGKHHWSKDAFKNELSNDYSKYLVALIDLKVVGYIGYWRLDSEGHITTLAVDDNYRRNHIADILLYSLIQNAIQSKINWLTLEVRATNYPAINLYHKYKFKQLGIRKKYYQDNNEDALIFWTENIQDKDFINTTELIFNDSLQADRCADKLRYTVAGQ